MNPTSLLLKISSFLLLGLMMQCNAQRVLTAGERTTILTLHNAKRGAESSSNMNVMVWDALLAAQANETTGECSVPIPGANVYVFSGTKIDLAAAVNAWYKPKVNYSFVDGTCAEGQNCNSYLQMVGAEVDRIGCAFFNCSTSPLNTSLVCVYGEGELATPPYSKGPACSHCSSGTYFCTSNGLCDSSCKTAGANCVCKAACQHCGTPTSDCKCQCSAGWQGPDCSGPCNDTLASCGTTLTQEMCGSESAPWVADFCPKLCGVCAPSVCPKGFNYVAASESCYLIAYQKDLTRAQAQTKCAASKSNLAFIETDEELTAVTTLWIKLFPAHAEIPMWTGGCRKNASLNENSGFVWSSACAQTTGAPKTSTTPFATTKWASSEPNNIAYDANVKGSGEWCVEVFTLSGADAFNDVPCDSKRNFYVCEADPKCK